MSNEDNRVAINVLHYNDYEKTRICVNSCLRYTTDQCVIIIIDNKSTNDSLSRLKEEYSGKKVLFLENDDNYGYAKGNNIGVKYAAELGCAYCMLLNNDTELIGNTMITDMLDIIENDTNCAIVAPLIYNVEQQGLVLINNDALYLKLLRIAGILPQIHVINVNREELSEAQGSALLVNCNKFITVGGFPEHYFMYGEESTFAKKIQWRNGKIIWYKNKDNYVLHHHDKSVKIDNWRLYLMGRNRAIEYMENKYRKSIRWTLIYNAFFMYMILKKQDAYVAGMKDGIRLVKDKKSPEAMFQAAKLYVTTHHN